MPYLLDTNILARLANQTDALFLTASTAIRRLHSRGESLHVTPQILIEFRNAATRPAKLNGLGLSTVDVEAKSTMYVSRFPLLTETPDIYPAWKSIVETLGIIGKQVHDARLVAVCHVHAITHLLTFNLGHFHRMAMHGPGIVIVDPATV